MGDVHYNTITTEEEGQRLDNYLIRILKGVPKSHIYRIIRSGEVRVNKKRAKASTRLATDDAIRIPPIRTSQEKETFVSNALAKQFEGCVLYEDGELLVVNKPAGIAVHGGSGVSLGMIEGLRAVRNDLKYLELVHRLDRETSGCLLLAKKRSTLRAIQALLANREVTKTYWALVKNPWLEKKALWVDVPLLKNTLRSGERIVIVSPNGKDSMTHFKLMHNAADYCWVEVKPKTGRTHQIRVHSAYLQHPIIGDEKYGDTVMPKGLTVKPRLFLHAQSIEFMLEGVKHRYEAPLDACFATALKQLTG